MDGCPQVVKTEFVQSQTTLQDRNISMNEEHSAPRRADGISSHNQLNIVLPLAQRQNMRSQAGRGLPFFTSSQSTKVDSSIENDPKTTIVKNHPFMILCAFSRLLIAIGTDHW